MACSFRLSVLPPFRLLFLALVGCQASTTRPTFGPLPGAATAEVHLGPEEATRVLVEALKEDSIPARFVHEGDGVVVSEWVDVPGYQVSVIGSLIGFFWGAVYGFVVGYLVSTLYNRIAMRLRAYRSQSVDRDTRATVRRFDRSHLIGRLGRQLDFTGTPPSTPSPNHDSRMNP